MIGSSELSAAGIEWLGARLRHLQTLSAALAGARTEAEAIEATLDRGLAVFEADQAVIATLDDAGREFRIVGMRGYPGEVESNWASFPNSDDYPLSEAIRRGELAEVKRLLAGSRLVTLTGSGRIIVDTGAIDLRPLVAVRVAPASTRELEAGRDGLEVLAFGSHSPGDGEMVAHS